MPKRPIASSFSCCASAPRGLLPASAAAPAKKPPVESLLIGLIPEQNIFKQMERYEPLMEYPARKTGTKMKLKILPRYGNIVDNFKSSGMDGAFSAASRTRCPREGRGGSGRATGRARNTSTYHGLIFVRKAAVSGPRAT